MVCARLSSGSWNVSVIAATPTSQALMFSPWNASRSCHLSSTMPCICWWMTVVSVVCSGSDLLANRNDWTAIFRAVHGGDPGTGV